MSRSPATSPHSSDDYSESSSVSSTRSIKPATPTTSSSPSRTVSFEDEGTRGRSDDGWKMRSGRNKLITDYEEVSPRYATKTAPANSIIASTQDHDLENRTVNGEAVVLGCTQYIKTGSCAYGDECKYSHVSLVLSSTQSSSIKSSNHGDPKDGNHEGISDYETASRETKRAIDHLLKKTKMCHAFNKGKCDYGYACRFAHIAGHDAFQILSRANAAKNCPFQVVLGQCSTKGKGCHFKHPPIKRPSNGKGKKDITSGRADAKATMEGEENRADSGGSGSGSGSQRSGGSRSDEEFAREINDLIDLREALKDVHVSRE